MIQSDKFDSSDMDIKKISIDKPFLTKDFAKLNPVNPPPKIQSFILIFNFNNKN